MKVKDLKEILERMNDDDLVCVIDNKTLYTAKVTKYPTLGDRVIFVREEPRGN